MTATFDAASLKTRTPAAPALCPVEQPGLTREFDYPLVTLDTVFHFHDQVLEFLNAGGTRQAVISAYHQHDPEAGDWIIQERDITGDGVSELLLTASGSLVAFGCQSGHYQSFWIVGETYHDYQPIILDIQDMNLDGVAEIMTLEGDDRIRIVRVFEWDGSSFQLINFGPRRQPHAPCSSLYGPSWAEAVDTDGNGTLELVLEQAIPIWDEYASGLPWREETRTCAWNGEFFVLTQTEIETPPEYRFQAVQDADRATLAGDYTKALELYQQSIFDDTLEWWSQDRKVYEIGTFTGAGVTKPTPIPSLLPDPAEYPTLAAYARFRIMLLHVASGYIPEAQIVYNTLQEKFPPSQPGYAQAEMATAFWDEYQKANDLGQACSKAIEYAAVHPADILAYLGNGEYARMYYGDQSLEYRPEDVCPFQ